MVNIQTIAENDMVSKTIEKDTKTMSEMIMVPETIYKNDMVFNNNAITIAKNDTVLAEDNKTPIKMTWFLRYTIKPCWFLTWFLK